MEKVAWNRLCSLRIPSILAHPLTSIIMLIQCLPLTTTHPPSVAHTPPVCSSSIGVSESHRSWSPRVNASARRCRCKTNSPCDLHRSTSPSALSISSMVSAMAYIIVTTRAQDSSGGGMREVAPQHLHRQAIRTVSYSMHAWRSRASSTVNTTTAPLTA